MDTLQQLLKVVIATYKKHVQLDESIGWNELEDDLRDAICNVVGDTNFCNWLDGDKPSPCAGCNPEQCILEDCLGEWLYQVSKLDKLGTQINKIYKRIDTLLCAHEYCQVDWILKHCDVKMFKPEVLVGFLSITLTATNNLRERKGFVERMRKRFEDLKLDFNDINVGLV